MKLPKFIHISTNSVQAKYLTGHIFAVSLAMIMSIAFESPKPLFRSPDLTDHRVAVPLAVLMCRSTFESPKPHPLTHYLENSILEL